MRKYNIQCLQEKLELRSALTLGVKNGVYVSAEARTKVVA